MESARLGHPPQVCLGVATGHSATTAAPAEKCRFQPFVLPRLFGSNRPIAEIRGPTLSAIRRHDPELPAIGLSAFLFLKVSGKELDCLGLRFLIHLGVVSER